MDLAKLDASIARFKAHTLKLQEARRKIVRIDEAPKLREERGEDFAKVFRLPVSRQDNGGEAMWVQGDARGLLQEARNKNL
jgi:hypothetical protein